jgi:hypothetical protein
MSYTVIRSRQCGLEVWLILDSNGDEVGRTLSREGAERKVMQLVRKAKAS